MTTPYGTKLSCPSQHLRSFSFRNTCQVNSLVLLLSAPLPPDRRIYGSMVALAQALAPTINQTKNLFVIRSKDQTAALLYTLLHSPTQGQESLLHTLLHSPTQGVTVIPLHTAALTHSGAAVTPLHTAALTHSGGNSHSSTHSCTLPLRGNSHSSTHSSTHPIRSNSHSSRHSCTHPLRE